MQRHYSHLAGTGANDYRKHSEEQNDLVSSRCEPEIRKAVGSLTTTTSLTTSEDDASDRHPERTTIASIRELGAEDLLGGVRAAAVALMVTWALPSARTSDTSKGPDAEYFTL